MARACAGGYPFAFGCPLFGGPFGGQGPEMSNVDADHMWEQMIQLVDDGMLEFGRFLSQVNLETPESTKDDEQPSTSKFCRDLLKSINEARQKAEQAQEQEKQKEKQSSVEVSHPDNKWIVDVPLGSDITPNELKIVVKSNVMTIEVKKEEVSEDGSSRSYREFSTRVSIPDAVKVEEIKSTLQPDGVLKIEAPLPQPEAAVGEAKPTEIPVQMNQN